MMDKNKIEKVGKIVCYVALGVGTLGKMFFDKRDSDKAYEKGFEEYMKKKLEEKQ